jgi:predicted lactoylglutathione lyase
VTSDANVILDDDRNLCNVFIENAVQQLLTTLTRRINCENETAITNESTELIVVLTMGENHDKNIITQLANACKEYLVKKTLEQWYNAEFGAQVEYDRINHLLHYRRRSVARRVRPLL